ncbi:hypothetical protein Tco_0471803 [Tanacetum coccineum]
MDTPLCGDDEGMMRWRWYAIEGGDDDDDGGVDMVTGGEWPEVGRKIGADAMDRARFEVDSLNDDVDCKPIGSK